VTVSDSVRQALHHWDRKEWDMAVFHASNAVDGTAKKRYPQLGISTRYRNTIRDALDIFCVMTSPGIDFGQTRFPIAAKSDLPDQRPDIADVLWGVHRHGHGHPDDLPQGFDLTPHGPRSSGVHIWQGGKIQLPAATALGLTAIAVFAPENKGESIPVSYQLGWFEHVFRISAWWGWQDHFREIISSAPVEQVTLDFGGMWEAWRPA
jgi:hypothetical protein